MPDHRLIVCIKVYIRYNKFSLFDLQEQHSSIQTDSHSTLPIRQRQTMAELGFLGPTIASLVNTGLMAPMAAETLMMNSKKMTVGHFPRSTRTSCTH